MMPRRSRSALRGAGLLAAAAMFFSLPVDVGAQAEDPAPMCPVNCSVDADCGTQTECSKVQLPDGTKTDVDLCWMDPDEDMCVKKCKIPRCIQKKCELAPPAEGSPGYPYVPCGTDTCGPPRCGDGVAQAGEQAQDPGPEPEDPVDPVLPKPKRPPLDCSNGYRTVQGKLSPTPSCAGGWYIQAPNKTCNCIMAALPEGDPLAPVASLLNGSSLLATSIINNCSLSCAAGFQCGAGEACFALVNARSVQRQCAPANCSGREAECGMTAYGNMQWQLCPGTAVPPVDPDPDPDEPVGQPTPPDGEECDDGNATSNDGCSPSCKKERCGDGTVQQMGADGKPNTADDEKCDDGNLDVGDGCSNTCAVETCGNGVHDQGEECDDGSENSDTVPGACRTDCMRPTCDDGVIDDVEPYGEQCECLGVDGAETITNENGTTWLQCQVEVDGFPALCGQCRANYCGDGFQFNPGVDDERGTLDDELCDAGPFNTDFPVGSGECTTHAQCPGSVCVDGECAQVLCSDDAECHGGKCVRQMCMPGGCANDEDCGEDGRCFEGQCRRGGSGIGYNMGGCTENTDCPSGYCYPNGSCMPEIKGDLPEPYCRMDCKPIRCGDGVVDVGAGETCDEGEAMFKCNGFPQPACDCAIPSWGNPQFNTTCCPENQYCSVWPTETCPVNCGVGTGGRGGACGNHQLDLGEECDVTVSGWQGEGSDWADAQVTYAYRPNRDGTDASFLAVDGNWKPLPSSVEQLYTTIDHDPLVPGDNAWMYSARRGTAKTYFHLWDIPLTTATIFNRVDVVASVDFSELEPDVAWQVLRAPMTLLQNAVNGADMNAAVLAVVADETAHTLTFTLHHSVTRQALTRPVVMRSPSAVSGLSAIAVDAIHVETYGTSFDESYACNVDLCTLFRCGNRHEEPGETCDDGNNQSNDGCSNTCQLEFCALPD